MREISDRQHAIMTGELVRSKVDVIVAVGAGDIRIAREATATIPVVMKYRAVILLEVVSLPVLRGPEETSRD